MILHLFEGNDPYAKFDESRLKLRATEQSRYQNHANTDLVAVYSCDASGVINYYNRQSANLWGRRPGIGDTDERFCGSHVSYRVNGNFMRHDQSSMADVLAGKITGNLRR